MSPKLVPAGVFTASVVPLKVIVVVPLMFVKFTVLVPLTLKTPVVLNVTGSAFTSEVPSTTIKASTAPIVDTLKMLDMLKVLPLGQWHSHIYSFDIPPLRGNTDVRRSWFLLLGES
jgi:hypothetical protein